MTDIFTCILLGLAGVVFHSLLKLRGLQADAKAANLPFDALRNYLLQDYLSILLSLLSVLVWVFLFGEIVTHYPKLQGFIRTSFFVQGAIGSWVLQLLLGTAKASIRKVVDQKTDIADGKLN